MRVIRLGVGALFALAAAYCAPFAHAANNAVPTYSHDIAPIIYQNCSGCHHQGQVAPFALMSYQDVQQHAGTIAAVTATRYMPPWKAEHEKGRFIDERRLTQTQIDLIQRWVKAGEPIGNRAAIPPAPHFASGWLMGKPDVIFKPDRAYHVSASGGDVYRCFVIPTNYSTDRWVKTVEIRPGNPRVVHHVIVYLDTTGKAAQLAAATHDGQPGYIHFGGPGVPAAGSLGGWAPGTMPMTMPHGVGMLLPKGAALVVQVHYHKDGKHETDLTRVGVDFCTKPVQRKMNIAALVYPGLYIPPGDANYTVHADLPIPTNVHLFSVFPHMHLLGHTMVVTATLPDGQVKPVIDIGNWNFNWQGFYTFKHEMALPAGTVLHMTATYNNSLSNPFNPNNPPKLVRWGEQTTDEMCLCFLLFTVDKQHLNTNIAYSK